MITLTPTLMMALRSRHNGFNGLTKHMLLFLAGVKEPTTKDEDPWAKQMLGHTIPKAFYKMLENNKNVHLDDINKYKQLVRRMHDYQREQVESWNNA